MEQDKSVRISAKTYKFLKELNKKTGVPIKRIIANFCLGEICAKRTK